MGLVRVLKQEMFQLEEKLLTETLPSAKPSGAPFPSSLSHSLKGGKEGHSPGARHGLVLKIHH